MSGKTCDRCGEPYKGFGATCARCRATPKADGGQHPVAVGASGSGAGDLCAACGKRAYAMERIMVEGKMFHPPCFKCAHCGNKISVGGFSKDTGTDTYYCRVHYDMLFRRRGRYSIHGGPPAEAAAGNSSAPSRSSTSANYSVKKPPRPAQEEIVLESTVMRVAPEISAVQDVTQGEDNDVAAVVMQPAGSQTVLATTEPAPLVDDLAERPPTPPPGLQRVGCMGDEDTGPVLRES